MSEELIQQAAANIARRQAEEVPPTKEAVACDFSAACSRMIAITQRRKALFDKWINRQPPGLQCPKHHHMRALDFEASGKAFTATRHEIESENVEKFTAVYKPCPRCLGEKWKGWMLRAGVPEDLAMATFDNFEIRHPENKAVVEMVRRYARGHRGFLILLGTVGTGKSHLAVATMRAKRCGIFRTVNHLMTLLSRRYADNKADDVIGQCEEAPLLVLDDVGVGTGRKDEWPTIHSILDYRHGNMLPTILTSNLTSEVLNKSLGDRLSDRIRQSLFDVLTVQGGSIRAAKRGSHEAKV